MKDFITNPIIPIWLMAIICVALLFTKRKGIGPFIRQILIVVLLFAINIRIMVPAENITVQKSRNDAYVIFVVDDTLSMLADDGIDGNQRFTDAKNDAAYIIEQLSGAKFAVISFHNSAQIMSPFTDDMYHAKNVINNLYPVRPINAFGTNICVSKDTLGHVIDNAQAMGDGKIYVFFISDGENTGKNTKMKSFEEYAGEITGGAVLGYGTEEGGEMIFYDQESDTYETVIDETDYNYDNAVSCIDEDNLKQIAEDLGVPYVHMTKQSAIQSTINDIKASIESTSEEEVKTGYKDTYYFFVFPLVILVAYEFISVKRKV